jgi:hypothetical protein
MNSETMRRSRDWEGIFRGVKNTDVFPAASMDGFTAARKIPSQFRRRSMKKLSLTNTAGYAPARRARRAT